MSKLDTVFIERGNTQSILDTALKARQIQHKAVTAIQAKIEAIISLKMVPGISEAGHGRETWGNMTDADIRSKEEHLNRLRAEKNSMKTDITDRKDSIERSLKFFKWGGAEVPNPLCLLAFFATVSPVPSYLYHVPLRPGASYSSSYKALLRIPNGVKTAKEKNE